MNIGKLGKWILRSIFGTARGNAIIEILEGPIGKLLDASLFDGKAEATINRLIGQARSFFE